MIGLKIIMKKENRLILSVGELWLKGKNKKDFVSRLLNNIREVFRKNNIDIISLQHEQGKINLNCICEKKIIIEVVSKISGISKFQFVDMIDRDINKLEDFATNIFDKWKNDDINIIKFKTSRRDKKYELTSPEINARLGSIASKKGLKCDYAKGVRTLNIQVHEKNFFISTESYSGMGGLPVGSSGKGLTLISGGIDSPVAAVRMINRGVRMDFIHFHTFATNERVLETKIPEIIKNIGKFSAYQIKLYVVPYSFFDLAAQEYIPNRMQVIFFKNFMHQFVSFVIQKEKYNLMVNGDSLAQVASQTPENMVAAMQYVDSLLLRPLVGMNKEEIIKLSKKYDLYEKSLEPYKDCCSLVAKNPLTRVKLDKFLEVYKNFPMKDIIEKTYDKMDIFKI